MILRNASVLLIGLLLCIRGLITRSCDVFMKTKKLCHWLSKIILFLKVRRYCVPLIFLHKKHYIALCILVIVFFFQKIYLSKTYKNCLECICVMLHVKKKFISYDLANLNSKWMSSWNIWNKSNQKLYYKIYVIWNNEIQILLLHFLE